MAKSALEQGETMIYLDNNASMELYPQAIVAATDCLIHNANSGAPHTLGRAAKARLEACRETIAKLVDARADQVLFTSGATEANNMAIMGKKEKYALVSAMEHSSVTKVHPNTIIIPVNTDGVVDLAWLEEALKDKDPGDVVVCVMFASHETGVLQPLEAVAELTQRYGQRLHVDAVQGVGKTPIDFNVLSAQTLSLTAHKIGGAQGIGALVYDPSIALTPLVRGGGQEDGRRPGTPNISGAASFEAAAKVCIQTMEYKSKRLNKLRSLMEAEITRRHQQVHVISQGAERLAGTSRLLLPNVPAEEQVMFMDLNGICLSAGAACSSDATRTSNFLLAMGYNKNMSKCSIRVGMGWNTTDDDIQHFIATYGTMVETLTKRD